MRQAVQRDDRLPQVVHWPGIDFLHSGPQGTGFCGSMI